MPDDLQRGLHRHLQGAEEHLGQVQPGNGPMRLRCTADLLERDPRTCGSGGWSRQCRPEDQQRARPHSRRTSCSRQPACSRTPGADCPGTPPAGRPRDPPPVPGARSPSPLRRASRRMRRGSSRAHRRRRQDGKWRKCVAPTFRRPRFHERNLDEPGPLFFLRGAAASDPPSADVAEHFVRRGDAGQAGAFHEPLPLVERVGVLAGELQRSGRFTFEARDAGELPRQVAGV